MNIKRHGFTIGIERIDSDFFLSLKATGKLTHSDYETIAPLISSALAEVNDPKVRVFIDGSELEGWEIRAAWDDFKLGLKHNNEFHKIAIYGNKHWQEMSARVGNWFSSGEIKFFHSEDEALFWLNND